MMCGDKWAHLRINGAHCKATYRGLTREWELPAGISAVALVQLQVQLQVQRWEKHSSIPHKGLVDVTDILRLVLFWDAFSGGNLRRLKARALVPVLIS